MCEQLRLTLAQGLGDLGYGRRRLDMAVLSVMVAASAGGTAAAARHWQRRSRTGDRQGDPATDDPLDRRAGRRLSRFDTSSLAQLAPAADLFLHAVLHRDRA